MTGSLTRGGRGSAGPRVLVLDNYDSFTFNLVHYLGEAGAEVRVARNDALTVDAALAEGCDGILISPGPGRPEGAGISLALVNACAEANRPLLGICLGMQAIATAFGGTIERAPKVMHGKTSWIVHDGGHPFDHLPAPFRATRYHSLAVREADLPSELVASARAEDGTIQALRHRRLPIAGVQFHPESIASEHGHMLIRNFVRSLARRP